MCEMYQRGTTPLIWATNNGHLPVVEYLMERGADIEASDAVSHVTMKPLTRHASPYPRMNQNGVTPLLSAAIGGRLSVVEYLLERGANIEAKNNVSGVII